MFSSISPTFQSYIFKNKFLLVFINERHRIYSANDDFFHFYLPHDPHIASAMILGYNNKTVLAE